MGLYKITLRNLLFCFLILFVKVKSAAQVPDYAAAAKFDRANLAALTGTVEPNPMFVQSSNYFWYPFSDDRGSFYYWVDVLQKKQFLLLNKSIAAQKLGEMLKLPVDSSKLQLILPFGIKPTDTAVEFTFNGKHYLYKFYTQEVENIPAVIKNQKKLVWKIGSLNKDSSWSVYSQNHDLYLKRGADAKVFRLSTDGAPFHSFGLNISDTGKRRQPEGCSAVWLDHSACFYVIRDDSRKVQTLTVINSLAYPRPGTDTYRYELPGDEYVTQQELFIGDTLNKSIARVNLQLWKDQTLTVVGTDTKSREIYVLLKKRTRDEIALYAVNVLTKATRKVLDEVAKPYFDPDMFNVKVIDEGKKIIWWSDRSGWGHYYVYNSQGQLLKELGSGAFTAGKIHFIDDAHHAIYFMAFGKEAGRDPYYGHLYRADLNSGDLKLLTPENASHIIHFSPGGNFFIDTYSTIQQVPVTVLRYANGKEACVLQKPSFGKLYNYGWRPAEPFTVKAADGKTDLYGLMWKPFNFDPNKKYPVISQVYPGPQTETVWTDFTVYDKYNNAPLAQLGFIVVCMGHRGGSPIRNKQYASYGYGNLRDAPLADDKYGLEQLANRFSFIDINRVGIFGHSGGGMMALSALCNYPDFYKVAVASSGDHDLTIYNRFWGETYQGLKTIGDSTVNTTRFKFNAPFDKKMINQLKGNLLIVTGESDQNVHPSNTMRVVDALVRANKQFDMLVLPGQSHHYDEIYQPYFEKRLRNYFVEHLMSAYKTN